MILACIGCGKSLKIADEHAGRRARCPSCRAVIEVPSAEASRVGEPVMQPAVDRSALERPSQTRLPMSAPEHTYEPALCQPVKNSTALVPAPPAYQTSPSYAAPQPATAPGHYESHAQPYAPYHQQRRATVYHRPRHQADPGIAALLEVLGGMFAQTFGIGHIYAGNVTTGLLFMLGYWFLCVINFVLLFVFIGVLTFPLCWVLIMIISPIVAANSVKRY